jgi:hypothetical protein
MYIIYTKSLLDIQIMNIPIARKILVAASVLVVDIAIVYNTENLRIINSRF